MSLFRRVTRYRIGAAHDPRENRLTEVTAAVLERVPGLAQSLLIDLLAATLDDSPVANGRGARKPDANGVAASAASPADHLHAELALRSLEALAAPRLRVNTQVTTQSKKFVDLELRLRPQPFEPGEDLLVWVEVKHEADVHGTQLTDYVADIELEDADRRLVMVLAPREAAGQLSGVPPSVPVMEWQTGAQTIRRWARRPNMGEAERFLLGDYLAYLQEEGLMDDELLTAEHAFVLRAQPAAGAITARLVELTDAYVAAHWGRRLKAKGGEKHPSYGLDYWAHYGLLPDGSSGASPTWRSTVFEWGLTLDSARDDARNAWVFFAGATFWVAKDNPGSVTENAEWLSGRRKDGFEYVSAWYWRLNRYRYPEELLAETMLDGQVAALGEWVVKSFRKLSDVPPPV